jgi:ethanolamine utilization protein EutN
MRIAKVHGTVTLSRSHPSFVGARLKLATPLTYAELTSDRDPKGDTMVVWDQLGAGVDSYIAVSDGSEAAQPFRPEVKPVDAYNAAILDQIEIKEKLK